MFFSEISEIAMLEKPAAYKDICIDTCDSNWK
jgi:hypothetical protein